LWYSVIFLTFQNLLFDKKVKQVQSWGRYQKEWGGHDEMVKENEFGECILDSCLKTE
jgi:hypothetical protein